MDETIGRALVRYKLNLKQPTLTRDDLMQGSRGSGASAAQWHFALPFAYLFIYLFISILGTN